MFRKLRERRKNKQFNSTLKTSQSFSSVNKAKGQNRLFARLYGSIGDEKTERRLEKTRKRAGRQKKRTERRKLRREFLLKFSKQLKWIAISIAVIVVCALIAYLVFTYGGGSLSFLKNLIPKGIFNATS